jgi:hypothetical protein
MVSVIAAPPASAAAPACTGTGSRFDLTEYGELNTDLEMFFPAHSHTTYTYGGQGFWSCSLVQGSTGNAVDDLQQDINACYYPNVVDELLEPDGRFGPLTKAALVDVQRRHGIEANGQYGPQTARTMYHRYYNWKTASWSCARLEHFGWPGNSG